MTLNEFLTNYESPSLLIFPISPKRYDTFSPKPGVEYIYLDKWEKYTHDEEDKWINQYQKEQYEKNRKLYL